MPAPSVTVEGSRRGRPHRTATALIALTASALALLMAGVGSATAAKPFSLDPREVASSPDVAVDERGTAHIVWNEYVRFDAPRPGDLTHYCQVPRGARACAVHKTLLAPDDEIGRGTWVLVKPGGEVIVVSWRCCSNDYPVEPIDATFAWTSVDGGSSFSGPRAIGGGVWPEAGVESGPGPFAVSMLSDLTTGGVRFQAANLEGPPAQTRAELGAQAQPVLERGFGVAFVDPLTPIVALGECCEVSDDVYFRRFAGGTNYNAAGSWGPPIRVAEAAEADIASLPSGRKGVHLLTLEGGSGDRRFVHRRYDGQAFTSPQAISERGGPHFGDLFLDAGGSVHAVWLDADQRLRHRSGNGTDWKPPETVFSGDQSLFHLRGDAACDGGGMVVFDGNGRGPIRAARLGSTAAVNCAGGGQSCVESVRVGSATVIEAQEGCLRRKGSTFTTRGDVRVNGIDVLVGGRAGARASAPAQVVIDRAARTLRTTARVEARVGNVVLGREQLGWKLPAGTGEIRDLAGNPAALDTGKFGSELLGLDVSGYVVPRIVGLGKGALSSNLKLPPPFTGVLGGGSTAEASLSFDNAGGLQLGKGLEIDVKDASIGIAGLAPFELSFNAGTSTLRGSGELKLPVVNSGLKTQFQLIGGEFDYGRASLTPPAPIPLAPSVFLNRIDFAIQANRGCETPTRLAAGGRITAVPGVVAGSPLLDVDPFTASYSFPIATCGKPGVFELRGDGKLVGLANAAVHATYRTSGQFSFGSKVDFDLEAAAAAVSVEGGVDLKNGDFYALGQADAELFSFKLASAETVVSSVGIAACGPAPPIPPPLNPIDLLGARGGFEYRWGGSFSIDWPSECEFDLEALIPAALQPDAAGRRSRSSARFALRRNADSLSLRLDGRDGAPAFALQGPGGLRISHAGGDADPVSNRDFQIFPAPSAKQTNVRIFNPPKGDYTVAEQAGSSPLAAVSYGLPLPKPEVKAKVRGRGGKRTLKFDARAIDGQSLLFVEQGRGGVREVIGETRKSQGRLRFRPATGPGGKRRVLAVVRQRGAPRAVLGVDSYRAPEQTLPGKPRKVRLKRRGKRLVVSWRKAARSKRHAVAWKLRDGRRGSKIVRGKRRLVIPDVPGIDAGSVRVAGLRLDNVAGKTAKAKLKPKPKKRKPRR